MLGSCFCLYQQQQQQQQRPLKSIEHLGSGPSAQTRENQSLCQVQTLSAWLSPGSTKAARRLLAVDVELSFPGTIQLQTQQDHAA